jgi:hypothetical protein
VIIYDYADMKVPVPARMAAKRRVGYHAIGHKVLGTRDLFSGPAAERTRVGDDLIADRSAVCVEAVPFPFQSTAIAGDRPASLRSQSIFSRRGTARAFGYAMQYRAG